jgi:phosphate transport system permease protein
MTDVLMDLPPDPILERRRVIQETASKKIGRRQLNSRILSGVFGLTLVLSLIPLVSVLATLIKRGVSVISWGFLTHDPIQPTLINQNAVGGIGNAMVGSLVVDGIAALVAVPLAILIGLYLAETESRTANFMRAITEIMTGLPSILLGVFAYIYIVLTMKAYSGFAAIVAITFLMVPVITKAAETAIRGVPHTLREAGLALGARNSKVSRGVILPVAAPGLITGVLLSLARAVGETAPILLVIGISGRTDWNPFHQMSALPLDIYQDSASGYASQQQEAWGIALVLVVAVLVLSLGSRFVAARMRREQR